MIADADMHVCEITSRNQGGVHQDKTGPTE